MHLIPIIQQLTQVILLPETGTVVSRSLRIHTFGEVTGPDHLILKQDPAKLTDGFNVAGNEQASIFQIQPVLCVRGDRLKH